MVTNNVDMDEANILADFFNLQATKHGPEMIRKLNNIGGLKQVSGQESRVLGQKQAESAVEQRKQIKIEVEAETVINQEIKLEVGREMTQPGLSQLPLQLLLPPAQARLGGAVQYLLSQDGKLVPLLPSPGPSLEPSLSSRPRGVSVIQRAPGPGSAANPNIILERRVEEVSVYSHHSHHSPPGESRHRMIDTTTAGSQDTSLTGPTLGGKHSNKSRNQEAAQRFYHIQFYTIIICGMQAITKYTLSHGETPQSKERFRSFNIRAGKLN